MKKMFSNIVDCMKNTQISKHYDSETKLICGNCDGQPLTIAMKGDFTVNSIQILAVCAAMSVMCITTAIVKKAKK